MKPIIVLLLFVTCIFPADDIGVTTTVKTNAESGRAVTKEYFTRAGQTNLLRSTTTTNGVVRSRLYRFYHDRKHVADHLSGPKGFLLVQTYNGFNFGFTSTNGMMIEATVADRDENVLDMFEGTNGVLFPIATSELRKYMSQPKEKPKDKE
jgi:hypothetical protein